ncbi:serine hydrolase domain-containing protein [Streptomyces sp. NPDC000594]|uniref:serine hydrolase domain-containing protein n=1 Tax=Streptomyces sp. NPDC000594 TaxID=3154261 RepID=UPI0033300D20
MTPLPRRSLLAGAGATALAVGAAHPALARPAGPHRATAPPSLPSRSGRHPTRSVPLPPPDTDALHTALRDLGHPPSICAQLRVDTPDTHWYGGAGRTRPGGGRAPRSGDRFRAGSVTKAFVATVVLKLWSQGRLGLDDPVGRHLPGLLPPASARITVAQLLDHTSGLPDHRGLPDLSTPEAVLRHRFDRWTPRRLVATVAHGGPVFEPGTAQEYRGIHYVLLALIVEAVTGRPYGEVIDREIARPLRLGSTLTPGNDPRIHGPHLRGTLRMSDGSLRDITVRDRSSAWGEGELISTVDDLARFQYALFSGELLPPHAQERLFALPPGDVRMVGGGPARYSTGLQWVAVNGVTFWGKTGDTPGYRTRLFATSDLRLRFVLSYTPTPLRTEEQLVRRIAAILTGGAGGRGHGERGNK